MPGPEFPWESPREVGEERYIAIDLAVLDALKALALEPEPTRLSRPTAWLLLRIARVDEVAGRLVLGVRLTRDLESPEQ